jgi:head-tail adaptor
LRSRRFKKRIEIFELTDVSDGFGGNTVSEAKIGESWANIRTLGNRTDLTDFGINNTDLAVEIETRKRSDLTYNSINQLIKYKGDTYSIVSFPTDQDFKGSIIKFIAVKQDG